jgi:phosphoglycerate kinase
LTGAPYFQCVMTLKDVDFSGKRVFIRVDFNVPLTKDGRVADDFRIRSSLPTIRYVLEKGGRPILASHLGRPKGKRVVEFSLEPARGALEDLLKAKVRLAPDCVGDDVGKIARALPAGEVLLLENLRFHAGEEANDPAFARELASLADVYVNDAFGTAHRAHASTEGVARLLRPAVAGLLMEKEIEFLGKLLAGPDRPLVAILGGAKVTDKIGVIKNLMGKVDGLLVGGGMANTFLKAEGLDVGASLVEPASVGVAAEIMSLAASSRVELVLPVDFVAASKITAGADTVLLEKTAPVPDGFAIADIGPKTILKFCDKINTARTIFWNGPVGVFEVEDFARGTIEVARAVAAASVRGAVSVIGGGDTASAVAKAGVKDKMTHISTGGGASLEFVEGKELPGILALSKKGGCP